MITLGGLIEKIKRLDQAASEVDDTLYDLAWCDTDAPARPERERLYKAALKAYEELRDEIIIP
jgi:hypothetical protein